MSKQAKTPQFDEIGYWSEVKLEIVNKYAAAYSKIMNNQQGLHHVYIDAFAGTGMHKSKSEERMIPGSPSIALKIKPPFKEYYFIDIDAKKMELLKKLLGEGPGRHYEPGDCNKVLLDQVFPNVQYRDYRRGLCLLDPYGLDLNWEVMRQAGQMKTIDMFLNFPIMDMNRNSLWTNPDRVSATGTKRMSQFWGDESWRDAAYRPNPQLSFLTEAEVEKNPNEAIAEAFKERLKKVAGFGFVAEPIPMRNSKGSAIYYLFFASQKPVAKNIVEEIFAKFRTRSSSG